jgi:molybdopterin molybdotransferase
MISIEEAEKILSSIVCRPEVEEIPLPDSLGRVLARDIVSRISMPPFDKSAMDGYALRQDDDAKRFAIIETIAAGSIPTKTIGKGECAKIMTGAMLPPGADRVIKKEVTEEKHGYMFITGEDKNVNICFLGEDVKPGDTVLNAGHRVRPQEVGIIASMGIDRVAVYKRATVGILTTGSEIKEPGQELGSGQIYNSNAYSLSAQVRQTGAQVRYEGIAGDEIANLRRKIETLLEETRIVLISGGVSEGDYDFVPRTLEELGVRLHFAKVAIKPGKPTVFGTRGDTVVFGMPGNPVSTFIIFEIFVKPLLYRTMGHNFHPPVIKGIMAKEFKRKHTQRTAYIPVHLNRENEVEPLEYHGSAHLNALAGANGLITVPRGTDHVLKGSTVYVRQL